MTVTIRPDREGEAGIGPWSALNEICKTINESDQPDVQLRACTIFMMSGIKNLTHEQMTSALRFASDYFRLEAVVNRSPI